MGAPPPPQAAKEKENRSAELVCGFVSSCLLLFVLACLLLWGVLFLWLTHFLLLSLSLLFSFSLRSCRFIGRSSFLAYHSNSPRRVLFRIRRPLLFLSLSLCLRPRVFYLYTCALKPAGGETDEQQATRPEASKKEKGGPTPLFPCPHGHCRRHCHRRPRPHRLSD